MTNKISFISNLTPSTSYGINLFWAINNINKNTIAYGENTLSFKDIKQFGLDSIIPVWDKSYKYFFQILKQIKQDKPKVVHIQHEINIYGSLLSVIMFPLLLLILRLKKIKVVVTVHALPALNQINKEFIHNFQSESKIKPGMLKFLFFLYYKLISIIANKIIVHTNLIADIYKKDYKANKNKINIIPIGCHDLTDYNPDFKPYFLYMGYLVNRKGLQMVIDGFADFIKTNPNNPFELKIAGSAIKGQEFAKNKILEVINFYSQDIKNKIHTLGFINQEQVDHYYKSAYAVVIPSKINIAASGPLSWAFSYGKCVLASDVGNLQHDIKHNHDGLLIQNNYKNWSNAFKQVASDFELVQKLQKNASIKAKQRNWINVAKMHDQIYQSLM